MNFLYKSFCTAFGIGYIPFAPGTFGSLEGLFFAWLIKKNVAHAEISFLILTVLVFAFGVFFAEKLIKEWGNDPSKVVIDEVVGMWISLWFIKTSFTSFLLAFFFFRLFDITKPFGIRKIEKLPGGWGIMLDDAAAGILSNLLLQIIIAVYHV